MSSGCNARVSAQVKSDALEARAFLDHGADGVNGFLVQASVGDAGSSPRARACVSMAPTCDNGAPPRRGALRNDADRPRGRAAAPAKLPPAQVS